MHQRPVFFHLIPFKCDLHCLVVNSPMIDTGQLAKFHVGTYFDVTVRNRIYMMGVSESIIHQTKWPERES